MNLRQLEFWIATLLVTVSLSASLAWMSTGAQGALPDIRHDFWAAGLSFNYVLNYFLPNILPALIYYVGFLGVMFIVFPRYYEQKQYNTFIGVMVIVLIVVSAFFAIDTYLKEPGLQDVYNTPAERQVGRLVHFLDRGLVHGLQFTFLMALYLFFREILVPRIAAARSRSMSMQSFVAHFQVFLFIWIPVIVSVFLVRRDAFRFMLFISFCALPLGFLLHAINYIWLIPYKQRKKMVWWKYWPMYVGISLVLVFVVTMVFGAMVISESYHLDEIFFISWIWLVVLVTPFSWIVYQYGSKAAVNLTRLRSELSTSHASLDFLKSQINPHFLFNALNTLYGTAIQENSEKTAQGIQMLGDMMRFMLYDNLQDAIPLNKEIHYMRNYIDLQKLRTESSDKIRIDTALDETACHHSISPMLLIPFVENAFKHGISLIRPSWIKVSLTCTADRLYFDVYNSVHAGVEEGLKTDPEAENSGIGLENVRQRLVLLYPQRHELTIHQSQTEYFIHLTIQFPHGR